LTGGEATGGAHGHAQVAASSSLPAEEEATHDALGVVVDHDWLDLRSAYQPYTSRLGRETQGMRAPLQLPANSKAAAAADAGRVDRRRAVCNRNLHWAQPCLAPREALCFEAMERDLRREREGGVGGTVREYSPRLTNGRGALAMAACYSKLRTARAAMCSPPAPRKKELGLVWI